MRTAPAFRSSASRARAWAITAALLFGAGGLGACRSFHARYVQDPSPGQDIGGVPIVLEHPKYLKVTHRMVEYGLAIKEGEGQGGGQKWKYEKVGAPEMEVTTEVVSVGEVYAVDVERPLSGTAKSSIEFQAAKQFPSAVKQDIDDRTLNDVVAGIDKLAGAGKPGSRAQDTTVPAGTGVVPIRVRETVVRIDFYEIGNPNCLVRSFCPGGCGTVPGAPPAKIP